MANEVSIRVTAKDDTEAIRAAIKAGFAATGKESGEAFNTKIREEIEKQTPAKVPVEAPDPIDDKWRQKTRESTEKSPPAKLPVEAKNPIDEAWRATIQASIKGIASDAIKIPVSPETAKYREELLASVGELQSSVKQKIPAELDKADEFKARVEAMVRRVSEEVKAKITVEADADSATVAGDKTAENVTSSASKGINARSALIQTAIGAAIIGGGPVIAAAGIGAGVTMMAAFGGVLQRGNPAIAAGWAKLRQDAISAATVASAGIVDPLTKAMTAIDGMVTREAPVLKKLFTDAGADIPILTQGFDDFTSKALPGFESGLSHSQPVVQGLAGLMGDLGGVVGDTGAAFGQSSNQVETGLDALGSTVRQVGHTFADLIGFSTALGAGALPVVTSGINGLLNGASALMNVLRPIGPELGAIGGYGLEAWSSFKLAGFASAGVTALSGSLGTLSTSLTGVGTKMLDSRAGSTAAGVAMAEGAGKAATFAGKAASLASTMAGPLGLALGVGVLGLELFGQASEKAAENTKQQQQVAESLTQIMTSSNGIVDTNTMKQSLLAVASSDAGKALLATGYSQQALNTSLQGGPQAIQAVIDKLQAQKDALHDTNQNRLSLTASQFASVAGGQASAKTLDDQITALTNIKGGELSAAEATKAFIAAQNQQAASLGISVTSLNSLQTGIETYDSALNNQVANFLNSTSAIRAYDAAVVAAAGASLGAQSSFKQLDAAVVSAEDGVASAAAGITSAQHSLVDAGHAVDSARHSEAQAVQGVVEAQYSYQQALTAEKAAQQGVMAARQAAADQLASLQRQVIDQGDTEAEAKLRLMQAQDAVKAAGLSGKSLGDLGDPTSANQTQYQLLLSLQEAQHNLNDVSAQGADLAKQNNDAQRAGIDGSQGVIQAQQQLASAQHSTQQASRSVADAQYAEQQASLAVQDALWGQQSAQLALTQAQRAGLKAQQDLVAAKDADSRTLDINTDAGNRNWKTVADMYDKNFAVIGTVQGATAATELQTGALGFNKDAVGNLIGILTGLNGNQFGFSVVGTPSLDLGPVRGILQNNDLGLFTNWKGESGGQASAGRLAAGGSVSGPGGPRDDAIHAMLSAGEYVQPADVVDHYGIGYMEALRAKKLPRFADGGSVSPYDMSGIMGLNLEVAALTGLYVGAGRTANAMGARPPAPVGLSAPGQFSAGAFTAGIGGHGPSGPVPGVPSSRAANEAIVQSIFSGYGWGSGAEWDAAVRLLMQESGFNNTAQNPTSTAYGMFQFLDDTWGGYGVPKTSDPTAQTAAGARYLKARYGDPLGAWEHEKAFNWYGAGGVHGGGIAGINDRGPELIKVPNGSVVASNADSRSMMAGMTAPATTPPEVNINFTGNVDTAFATAFMKLLRSGAIQIQPQYVR